jgi:hypothetical protein
MGKEAKGFNLIVLHKGSNNWQRVCKLISPWFFPNQGCESTRQPFYDDLH